MNIMLTTVSLDARRGGGTAERTRQLALELQSQGHSVTVVATDGGSMVNQLRDAGVSVHVTGFSRLRFSIPHLKIRLLRDIVRTAELIHILGYWNLLSAATAFLARRTGKPYALSPAGEFVGLEGRRLATHMFHALIGRWMIKGAAFMVAITPLEKSLFIDKFDVPADRAVILPNGVSAGCVSIELPGLPERPFALFLGRLAEVKGPDLLLEAFARVAAVNADYDLVVAGPDFGMEAVLHRMAAEPPLPDRVTFLGFLDESQRTAAYSRASLLCVPSRSEAMSLVALEGGMCGIPVLLTDRCGFDEVAAVNGGLVVPATVEGLAAGLETLLAPATDLKAMGANLQKHVTENFQWSVIARRLVALFDGRKANLPPSDPRHTS